MKLNLPNVTLLMIDGREKADSLIPAVIRHCTRLASFGAVKTLTPVPFREKTEGRWISIPRLESLARFNLFVLKKLVSYIDTEFCLFAQTDGFILHPENWNDDFLRYDYIGAPWPVELVGVAKPESFRVGNGGFSLRSRRLLQAAALLSCDGNSNEDVEICQLNRSRLEAQGLKFAPVEVAARFSLEFPIPEAPYDDSRVFGFHAWTPEREHYREKLFNSSTPTSTWR